MLAAHLIFSGQIPIGPIDPDSYFGNPGAIMDPEIEKIATGKYTITLLSARNVQNTQPAVVHISVMDDANETFCPRVTKALKFTYEPQNTDFPWKGMLEIAITEGDGTAIDPKQVMVSIHAQNESVGADVTVGPTRAKAKVKVDVPHP
ncbi:DUF807 family protein [Coxiella burnetii]|uniref:Uncharacterized protein n=1 Tax=Coxiella burnetii TaxID=777 RepID=O52876_COXBE|nr:DUF807 family protein [Coxiella burnetii]ACJ21255.1 hypothetical protein CbuK_A0022 [Coxiella burnetii CbuK_Q154]EAX32562.1 hypothetical protein A35_0037 [Coxiella burnetii 'MSU Goat Q177']PHH57015.1 hypothetical protein CRH12_07765 [Coxiella burnetii]UYK70730.1 DUF807 family protein [Coxiella burnetii]CAA75834.1 hypothetical protein [Coxiella burnetii]